MTKKLWIEIIGWSGALALLSAYSLSTFDIIKSGSFGYQALNLYGALAIIVNAGFHKTWPSVALNIVWGTVAVVSLATIYFRA